MKSKIRFSKKQLLVLSWWCNSSPYHNYQAIICDGAIRSGKTFSMMLSFILWAQKCFCNAAFAICGKTIISATRNMLYPILPYLKSSGFCIKYNKSQNYFDISSNKGYNRFYIFGGKDETSCSFIQGITLAGVLFDEVALQPQSFVEQAIARCSVEFSKIWFNCNPEGPEHWFYKKWIEKTPGILTLYLHFVMNDNLSLSKEIKERYKLIYSGSFYRRFIEGKWSAADGLVYQNFDIKKHVVNELPSNFEKYYVSCDYGITNPMSFGLWGLNNQIWYRIMEYYYDSKKHGIRKTDSEYYKNLLDFVGERKIKAIIIDPSASSFIECIKRNGDFKVKKADNDVIHGINLVTEAFNLGKILISAKCENSIREFSLYKWRKNSIKDEPQKQNDHSMDEIRYFVSTVIGVNQKANSKILVLNSIKRQV